MVPDHCPLSLMFKLNPTNSKKIHKNSENKDEISNVHPFKKFRWDVDSDEKYNHTIALMMLQKTLLILSLMREMKVSI